jgi:hypothetical protein
LGDVYYRTETKECFVCLGSGELFNMRGLLELQPQPVVGPQGEIGPQGIPGERGPIGPQGFRGEPGAAGSMGPAGHNGSAGLPGATGKTGRDGSIGPLGPQGIAGPQDRRANAATLPLSVTPNCTLPSLLISRNMRGFKSHYWKKFPRT